MEAQMEKLYKERCVLELRQRFGYENVMDVPRLEKIVVNTSLKEGTRDIKLLEAAANDIAMITGQKPVITRAKKSIASFKLRKGMPIGCKVTLRRTRMYEFLNRLINVALPRVRDFRGVPENAFDGRGNYTLGITEQTIFPEIDYDKVSVVFGMNVTIVTTAKTDEEAYSLLKLLGMPFRS